MSAPLTGYTRWYLRRERSFLGPTKQSAGTTVGDAETPMMMRPAAGNYPQVRSSIAVGSLPLTDLFFGSWQSPALKAGTYSGLSVKFNIGCHKTDGSTAGVLLKHYLYLARAGAYVSDVVAAVNDATELPVVYSYPNATATLDQEWPDTNQDANYSIGRVTANTWRGQGFTSGAAVANKLLSKIGLYLWRSGEQQNALIVTARSTISGAELQSAKIYPKDISNAIGAVSSDHAFGGWDSNTLDFTSESIGARQSWTQVNSGASNQVAIYCAKVGSPSGKFVVRIHDGTNTIAWGALDAASIATGYAYCVIPFSPAIWFTAGSVYYYDVHFVGTCDVNNYVSVSMNKGASYANGQAWTTTDKGVGWTSQPTWDITTTVYYATSLTYAWAYAWFDDPTILANTGQYYLTVHREGTVDPVRFVYWGIDSGGGYAGANNHAHYSSDGVTWTDETTPDLIFRTYYDDPVTNSTGLFRGRQYTATGISFTAQDGDHLVHELVVTGTYQAEIIRISFNGAEAIEDESWMLTDPYSYIEINADIATLWDDLLSKPGTTPRPVVEVESEPRLLMSTEIIGNISQPTRGILRELPSLARSIGDDYGNYQMSDLSISIDDTSHYLQRLAAQPSSVGNVGRLAGKRAHVFLLLTNGTLIDWREVFTGRVEPGDRDDTFCVSWRIKADAPPEASYPLLSDDFAGVTDTAVIAPWYAGDASGPWNCTLVDATALEYIVTVGYCSTVSVFKNGDASTVLVADWDYSLIERQGFEAYAHYQGGYQPGWATLVRFPAAPTSVHARPTAMKEDNLLAGGSWNTVSDRMLAFLLWYANLFEGQIDVRHVEDELENYYTRMGVTFGGGIRTETALATVLQQWGWNFGIDWTLNKDGQLTCGFRQFGGAGTADVQLSAEEIGQFSAQYGTRYVDGYYVDYDYSDLADPTTTPLTPILYSGSFYGDNANEEPITERIEGRWISSTTCAANMRTEHENRMKPPQPIYPKITAPLRCFALDLGQSIRVNHPAGEGQGYVAHECIIREINYQFGPMVEIGLKSHDICDGAIAGDENDQAATWATASENDRRYLYACDETTAMIAAGRYGKRVYNDGPLEGVSYR